MYYRLSAFQYRGHNILLQKRKFCMGKTEVSDKKKSSIELSQRSGSTKSKTKAHGNQR